MSGGRSALESGGQLRSGAAIRRTPGLLHKEPIRALRQQWQEDPDAALRFLLLIQVRLKGGRVLGAAQDLPPGAMSGAALVRVVPVEGAEPNFFVADALGESAQSV